MAKPPMQENRTPAVGEMLLQGVSQAVGFVAGALLGRGLGLLFGWNAFAPDGYTGPAMLGIVLIGLGGGAGLQLARRWYTRRQSRQGP
ncbi:hypothetical protein [Ottowia sp. VDI28]|uniref:hypothetical protein n=1 Tax=Ottowia sp. VDI28 TaxID=3133968 RepID=UPI003C2C4B1C